VEPSFVLKALGVPDDLAYASVRFSLGRFTTAEDISTAIAHVQQVVERLRAAVGYSV
jgi:cysteine desulfurase